MNKAFRIQTKKIYMLENSFYSKQITKNNPDYKAGFTLMELLIVISLLTIIASLGLFVSMQTLNNSSFHSGRDLYVTALEHARAQAINNICTGTSCIDGLPHGVHIETDVNGNVTRFIAFQGASYNSADTINSPADIGNNVSRHLKAVGLTNISFEQLSGNVSATGTVTFSDGTGEGSVVTIGSEGQISWTN
jgi:prepilin-type N-terminal cleavage/methylation domain-containing protein